MNRILFKKHWNETERERRALRLKMLRLMETAKVKKQKIDQTLSKEVASHKSRIFKIRRRQTKLLRKFHKENKPSSMARLAEVIKGNTHEISRLIRYDGGKVCPPEVKYQVLIRDKFICRICFKKPRRYAVHHVNGDSHTKENLITLCASCHGRLHQTPK